MMEERDPFISLFHHFKLAGHECDITDMMQGGFRAECSCGWFDDLLDLNDARERARRHIEVWRRHAQRKGSR
jgi:hypothetical protein